MCKQFSSPDFIKLYRSEDECREFLFNLKWQEGFKCKRCGHTKFWKGRTRFNVRCRNCRYDESALANTLFHKVKIPLVKAFRIVNQFLLTTGDISSPDLARQFNINQKTAWYFRRKLQQAIYQEYHLEEQTSSTHELFAVDSVLISSREMGCNGLQQIFLVKKQSTGSKKNKKVVARSIIPEKGKKVLSELVKGKFVQINPSINIWNFKTGFTGTYHHCSGKYVQGYVDEFTFRSNNRQSGKRIWYRFMKLLIHQTHKNTPEYNLNG
ncbi:MAG: transposase [Chitinophagaceae bacterium]|nr:MAG: transposase [Chitinophagaceae bacterium]